MKTDPRKKPQPQPPSRSKFRINVTAVAIFLVIVGSIASGIATAFLSYKLGRQSLSAVTTPPENPTKKIVKEEGGKTAQEFKIISEREILVKVYDFVYEQKKRK